MATKHDTEVLIGGKVFTLSGYESEEYLQRIAAYINGKISEYSKIENYSRQSVDVQAILLQLNIADDFFKAREKLAELQNLSDAKDKELYDVKHDLITTQIKMKSLEESLRKLSEENTENQKKIVKLETELGFTLDEAENAEADSPDGGNDAGNSLAPRRKTGKRRH